MFFALAVAVPLSLSGCAAGAATGGPATTIEYRCEWNIESRNVLLGETISVTRGADGPCEGLELGTSQLFELRSTYVDDSVKSTAEVNVAEDGSFSFDIRVPDGLRLNRAVLQAVPDDPACDDPEVLDCPPPGVFFTVRHPQSALQDVTLAAKGLDAPRLPDESLGGKHYYRPGPADDQVTLVIIGNGCETLPKSYVTTAAPDSLQIVSGVDCDGGPDIAVPWTTVIEVPDEYADYGSVKIDNVPAELLPPE